MAGLPGIATDLLTARLRTLEGAGLVQRRTLPKPAPASVYELTERGRLLGPALGALAQVGFGLLDEPAADADLPPERLVLALRAAYDPDAVPDHHARYQLELAGESFVLAVRGGEIEVGHGTAPEADLTLSTDPFTLIRLLRRSADPDEALSEGALQIDGRPQTLKDFLSAFALSPRGQDS